MSKFPHLTDSDFPGIENANASRYLRDAEFDYKKYDTTQMRITVCSVPWDVGLIHVGNAQIGGLGNVVKFDDKEARDAWFDTLEDVHSWETKYRQYHTGGYIEVPLPYEKCVLYNYVFVEYTTLPVEYAEGGKERFHFFIRECEALDPSNCRIKILRDTWQDYIYDVEISYMLLQQGHAGIYETDVDAYLANPIENNEWLLYEDFNVGHSYNTTASAEVVLNHEHMRAVVVTSSDLSEDAGVAHEAGWHTPDGQAYVDGQPAMWAYSMAPDKLSTFLAHMEQTEPQRVQCIKGVFFVNKDLIVENQSFVKYSVTLHKVAQKETQIPLMQLDKSQFGYAPEYANLAKLYTYPYAYLEICDESGAVTQVKIEETTGALDLVVTSSLAYPWLALDGRILGIGSSAVRQVTFSNVNEHSFVFGGSWYDHLHRWEIPSFAVEIAASVAYDYETHFEREQRQLEAETALANATLSATTAKTNAEATNNMHYDNAIRSADTALENTLTSNDAARTNADATDNLQYDNAVRSADAALANAEASNDTAKTNADATDNLQYGNAVRSADTVWENAKASNATTKTNADASALVAKENANRSADTTKTDADISAHVSKTNADNSALTAKQNADNSAACAKANADASADTAKSNSDQVAATVKTNQENNIKRLRENVADEQTLQTRIKIINNNLITNETNVDEAKINADRDCDVLTSMAITEAENQATSVTAAANGVSSIVGNTAMGAVSGATAGSIVPGVGTVAGAVVGGVGGLACGIAEAAHCGFTANISITTNEAIAGATQAQTTTKAQNAIDLNRAIEELRKTYNDNSNTITQEWVWRIAARNKETDDAANVLSESTTKAINLATQTTDKANARRTYECYRGNSSDIGNNARTYNAAVTNAQNTYESLCGDGTNPGINQRDKDTADANAQNTYESLCGDGTNPGINQRNKDTADANAKRTHDNATGNARAALDVDLANNERTQITGNANAQRTHDTATDNALDALNVDLANNERTQTAGDESAARTYENAINNALDTLDVELANNERTYDTAIANAELSYDATIAGIAADVAQAALEKPREFGEFSGGETSVTRPQGVFCNVVTQSKDAIEAAGDQFLRFGYACNRAYKFTDFNLMPKFTYWKAADMWIAGNSVPDAYLDELRFFILGGVCVWRDPADIGHTSIYENGR